MRFVGGKSRVAKDIAGVLLAARTSPGQLIYEPFCGALNVTEAILRMSPTARVVASDAHIDLIEMWEAVQDGWEPPRRVSRDRYDQWRASGPCPERTFVGYGCSFSGKWWGGYAESDGRNYAAEAARSVERLRPLLDRVDFYDGSYLDQDIPAGHIVYCDPPYLDTLKPGARDDFDHDEFWKWVASCPSQCYVSEYQAPPQFREVWRKQVRTDMHTKLGKAQRVERLFTV